MPKKKKITSPVANEPTPVSQGQLERLLERRESISSHAQFINRLPLNLSLLFWPVRAVVQLIALLLAEIIITPVFYGVDKLIEVEDEAAARQYDPEFYDEMQDGAKYVKYALVFILYLPAMILLTRWLNNYIHQKVNHYFSAGVLQPSEQLVSEASILAITHQKDADVLEARLKVMDDKNNRYERYITYLSRAAFLYNIYHRVTAPEATLFTAYGHGLTTFSLVNLYKDSAWYVNRFFMKMHLNKVNKLLNAMLHGKINTILDVNDYKKLHIVLNSKEKFSLIIGGEPKEVIAPLLVNALRAACLLTGVEVITFNRSAMIIDATNKAILSATFRTHYDTSLQCVVAKREEQHRLQQAAKESKAAQVSSQRLQPPPLLAPAVIQPVGTTVYQCSSAQSSVTIHPAKPDLATDSHATRHRDNFFRKNVTPSTRAASSTSTPRHFPLTAPWLKEGELLARIDSRLRDIIPTDDMYHAIENHIHHGRVVGNKAKTKTGGAGIVPCQFFYKSVEGPKQAIFKVKQGNVRVYGTRAIEETDQGLKQVVIFNGVDLRAH